MVDDLDEMLGARLLVGVTYLDDLGDVDERVQFVGTVTEVTPLVLIFRPGLAPFSLPPEPEAFDRAPPGSYRLRDTDEVVEDPDFLTSWTVHRPQPNG